MDWSSRSLVVDYYPVDPKPKWGYGQPQQPQVKKALEDNKYVYLDNLRRFGAIRDLIHGVPFYGDASKPHASHWINGWFSNIDATALMGFLGINRPKRYIEIGSGFSTMFAKRAVSTLGLTTHMTSIDPNPRASIDQLCDRVVRTTLEEADPALFDDLEPGDILFFDGSHRLFTNSDVAVFFFEIMPRLKPGVLVQIHDIFLPNDYPAEWNGRMYSEQYLLAAMLMCGAPPFEVVLPNCFLYEDADLLAEMERLFTPDNAGERIPLRYHNGMDTPGVSFWVRTK